MLLARYAQNSNGDPKNEGPKIVKELIEKVWREIVEDR